MVAVAPLAQGRLAQGRLEVPSLVQLKHLQT